MNTVRHNAYSKDLGEDFVALDANGTPVARAASRESVKAAAPQAIGWFNQAELDAHEKGDEIETPVLAPGADPTAAATARPNPDTSFERAVINAHRHSSEGAKESREDTVEKAKAVLEAQQAMPGQPNATVTEPDKATVDPSFAAMTPDDAKPDGIKQAEQADREEAGEIGEQVQSGQESKQPDPFDHDGDGKPGGSKPGDDSTVAQGRARRQRKIAK